MGKSMRVERELVSVIIPVHNTEKYLKRCLESVLKQSYTKLEIIIIDDGSTDNSFEILQNYSLIDRRIKLLKQKNQGQGKARNEALKNSTGEYIVFVDSDDRISEKMVLKLYEKIKKTNADFTCCRMAFEYDSGKIINYGKDFEYEILESCIYEDANLQKNIYSSPVNKIYKKEFLTENNLKFPEVKKNEDGLFAKKISFFSNRVSFVNEVLYYAYSRNDSTTRKFDKTNLNDMIQILKEEKKFLIDNESLKKYEVDYKNAVLKTLFNIMVQAIFHSNFKTIIQLKGEFKKTIDCYIQDRKNYKLLSMKYKIIIKLYKVNFWLLYSIIKMACLLGYKIT